MAHPTLRSVDGPPPRRAMLSSHAGSRDDARGGRLAGCERRRAGGSLMTSGLSLSDTGLTPLLAAKGRIPLLPHPHIPRPHRIAALVTLLREHRLVVLSAGGVPGQNSLLP